MTSFRNDGDNPYGRASVWPQMPQAPFRVGGPMGARTGGFGPAAVAAAPEPEAEPAVEAPVMAVETPEAFAIAPTPCFRMS